MWHLVNERVNSLHHKSHRNLWNYNNRNILMHSQQNVVLQRSPKLKDEQSGRTIRNLSVSHHCREKVWSYWYCLLSSLWKIHLTAACLIHNPHSLPVVHHQTSTILTSVEEISCQAFILLRDQGPSCSYLNITLLHCTFEIAGGGGISFIRALRNPECLGLTSGLQGDYVVNLCFTAAVSEKSTGG